MKKSVVIAEKPSVARDIARVLKCHKKGNGFLEGDQYIVTWALGHLVTLADPEVYGDQYKTWRIEDLPMLPKKMELVVIRQTNKQYQTVRKQLHRPDVGEIIIATDAGREGELVARWIIEKARVNKTIKRLWISSVTDKAIKEGMTRLKDGKETENLYAAAVARSEADWYVGLNATRALTCKFNAQLSAGRVQTPTVAFIAQREEDIEHFQPKTYYGLKAVTKDGLSFVWQDGKSNSTRTFSENFIDEILRKTNNKEAVMSQLDKKQRKSFSPPLYDLTELQRDANKIFNYSAKETLSIMQKLYEQHKVLTYPRTDSRYISSDIVETLPERLKAVSVGEYKKFSSQLLNRPIKGNKSFVDDGKVTDHHAIIPTEEVPYLAKFSDKERKIYDLVVKRFLAVLSAPFEYEQTTVHAEIGGETFIAKGKKVTSLGWKEIYGDGRADDFSGDEADDDGASMGDQLLPQLAVGDKIAISAVQKTVGKTNPPPRFTEATLLSAMENPAKYMSSGFGGSKKLAQTLQQTGGLGTVATRADIIEKLFNSFLIEKKGKDIFPTSKGKQLLDLVPEDLKSPALTAEMELKLDEIAKGRLSKNVFIGEMKDYASLVVREIKNSDKKYRHDNLTGSKCPDCGKNMLEVNTKNGKMHVCQDRECGYRKNIVKVTNARCPKCKKKLELRGQGDGQIFVCKCGHREKLSSFNKRRSKEKNSKLSKREINQYMNKQEKQNDEPFNSAMADALAKLKLK